VHYAPFLDRTTHTEDAVLPGRVDNILIIVSQCTCYIRQACHALVTVDQGLRKLTITTLVCFLQFTMSSEIKSWLSNVFLSPPPALPRMRLGPDGNSDNPLMVCDVLFNKCSVDQGPSL